MTESKITAKKNMETYEELFSKEDKEKAFDMLAAEFYNGNFGKMSKADMETLMFSIYINRILEKDEYAFQAYSDYTLAKVLGITQSRVSSLKIRKQLQYPREFDWRKSLVKVSKNARYENGKICIQIPDVNLYNEIKNAVEENGGYIDGTLTRNLLKISPEYFIDLMIQISGEKKREDVCEELKKELKKHNKDREILEKEPLYKSLKGLGKEGLAIVFPQLIKILAASNPVKEICTNVWNIIE